MSNIELFNYEGANVRVVVGDGGEPWVVTKDVCDVLGIANVGNVVAGLDDDEKGIRTVDTPGGFQRVSTVNESGLYSLILRSRKPQAKAFKRWITHEVLPVIRKTGAYIAPESQIAFDLVNNPDAALDKLIEVASMAREERAKRLAAEAKVTELEPRAVKYDNFLSAEGDYDVNNSAKVLQRRGIDIGQNRLFGTLEDIGWVYRDNDGHPRAYQSAIDRGYLREKPRGEWIDPKTKRVKLRAPQIRIPSKGLDRLETVFTQLAGTR